jgi:transformation/transcription domain-associated protein
LICRPTQDQAARLKAAIEEQVQPFLEFVLALYDGLPKTADTIFSQPVAAPVKQSTVLTDNTKANPAIRSVQSFKALTECPIIVVLLFQLYPKFQQPNIKRFLPLIIKALSIQPPEGSQVKHRQACVDLIAAQVKTLSFLAYLLQKFAKSFTTYEERVPQYAIQLLTHCPSESTSIRRVCVRETPCEALQS